MHDPAHEELLRAMHARHREAWKLRGGGGMGLGGSSLLFGAGAGAPVGGGRISLAALGSTARSLEL